jgi:hypothetical protein
VKKFLGVDPETLHALGCVVVAAGRLEDQVRDLLRNLYADPGKNQPTEILRLIRRQVRAGGVPPHARLESPDSLIEWTYAARDALSDRHELAHSAAAMQGSTPVRVHLRSREISALDATAVMDVAKSTAKLTNRGGDLKHSLMRQPRPGVFLPNTVLDGQWIPVCDVAIGGIDMERPTPEELDGWWRQFGPIPWLGERAPS